MKLNREIRVSVDASADEYLKERRTRQPGLLYTSWEKTLSILTFALFYQECVVLFKRTNKNSYNFVFLERFLFFRMPKVQRATHYELIDQGNMLVLVGTFLFRPVGKFAVIT